MDSSAPAFPCPIGSSTLDIWIVFSQQVFVPPFVEFFSHVYLLARMAAAFHVAVWAAAR